VRSRATLFSDPVHWPKLRIVHCDVAPDRAQGPSGPSDAGLRPLFGWRLAAMKWVRGPFEAFARTRDTGMSLTATGDGPARAHAETEPARIGRFSLMERLRPRRPFCRNATDRLAPLWQRASCMTLHP
jgi:hypothetical protein